MISIICPVYNSEKFLNDCVNSVLQQSFSDWELLLVDDGSTDNSSSMCDLFSKKDKRIKVFHKSNEGQWLTREFGISKANGDYFIFLDSDDMLEKDTLEVIYSYIASKDPNVILYDISKLNPDGSKTCLQELFEEKHLSGVSNIIDFCFVKNNCISLCVYCFKKSFYLSCPIDNTIDKTMKSQEDFLMLFNILQCLDELYVIPMVLYSYRTNNESASNSLQAADYFKNIKISDSIYQVIHEKYNSDFSTYSNKITRRLAWQPISYLKRAYVELDKKKQKRTFIEVKKSFIYNNFTKRYKFESKKDQYFLLLFRVNLHFLNKLLFLKK